MSTAKDLAARGRRRLALPLLCGLSAVVLLLGSLASLRATKFELSDDLFSRPTDNPSPSSHTLPSPSHPSLPPAYTLHSCNGCIHCTTTGGGSSSCGGLGDRVEVLRRSMDDEELLRLASMGPRDPAGGRARVAFMFLAKGRMPLRPLWERFFGGHRELFSIYVHTSPEFREEPPEGSVFFRRRITSKAVEWGRFTMIDAERRLLANALLDDHSNQWFLLLSESCIPLFNFTTVYDYLTNSRLSFLSSFDDPKPSGRGRYNQRMRPAVSLQEWRKGSQWFGVRRRLAVEIVSDRDYYPVFKEHCRPPCYMDEHYLPTMVSKLFPAVNSNRSLTWVDWSRGGSHPATFRHRDVKEGLIERMRGGSRCLYNGNTSSICFLFARKFDASTAGPLMHIAPRIFGF